MKQARADRQTDRQTILVYLDKPRKLKTKWIIQAQLAVGKNNK